MLQRKSAHFALYVVLVCVIFAGCSGSDSPTTQPAGARPATSQAVSTVVSLSPAATDLLLAMGAGDRLVGVSTYDNDPRVVSKPRVGDYENVDWERIASIAPGGMIMQMAPDRLPVGLKDRAAKLGIALYSAHIDRLDDITREAASLGEFLEIQSDAEQFITRLETSIAAARRRAEHKPRARTLIVVSENNLGVAGRNTYLDDLLIAAGGENVLEAAKGTYIQLDREALLALAPDAIVVLSPSPTEAQRAAAQAQWAAFAQLPAVREGRVLIINEPWALMPGAHVGELCERISQFLHP